jgi:hypothetical protein
LLVSWRFSWSRFFKHRAARGICGINRENEPTFRAVICRGDVPAML